MTFFCLVFVMLLCASVYWCFVVPCLERTDLLALVCECLIVKVSLSNWYPGSGVGLIVLIHDLCPLSYFHVFPRDNIRKPFTLCITQSLNSQIYFHLIYWIALFCI